MPLLIVFVVALLWLLSRKESGQTGIAANVGAEDDGGQDSPSSPLINPSSSQGQLDNIAQAIANLEGFGIPGARPTRDKNPGDLRSAPGAIGQDQPGGIAQFGDVGDGWDALNNYIASHAALHPDWDFYDFTHFYATGDTLGTPATGEANPDSSAEYIAGYLGVDPTTLLSTVLEGS